MPSRASMNPRRRHARLVLLAIAMAFVPWAARAAIDEDPALAARVEGLREQSRTAAQAGDLEQAIDSLKLAIEIGVKEEWAMRGELRQLLIQRAEELVAQGDELLRAKDYELAADRFIDSMGYITVGDAKRGLRAARRPARKVVRKAMGKAQWAYEHGDYEIALEHLRSIEDATTQSPTDLDRALVHHRLGQHQPASFYLDQYLAKRPDGAQSDDHRLLRAIMETGAGPLDPTGLDLPLYRRANRQLRAQIDGQATHGAAPRRAALAASQGTCDLLQEVRARVGDHPVLIYDLAYCFENQGQVTEAYALYERYLDLVPEAGDRVVLTRVLEEFDQLAPLAPAQRAEVRRQVASAQRLGGAGRYREAIAQLQAAERAAPGHPLPLWRLVLLHEALGEVEQARQYLSRYKASPNAVPERVAAGEAVLALAEAKVQRYDELVAVGREHTTRVMARVFEAVVVGTRLSDEYIQRELARAAVALNQALELFPLAYEANLHMSFVLRQTRNHERARQANEAVFAHGHEPTYFAYQQIGEQDVLLDSKARSYVRVSFDGQQARVRRLATYDRDQREWSTRWSEGALAQALWSEDSPLVQETFTPASTSVRTQQAAVRLGLGKEEYFLYPLYLLGQAPDAGRDGRIFGNEYARMFHRFAAFEDTVYGKERMTVIEALATVTDLAVGVYLLAQGYVVASIYAAPDTTPLALEGLREKRAVGRFRQEQLLAIRARDYKLLPISVELPRWQTP